MKILVTGAGGMLAFDLIPILKQDHDVIQFSKSDLDITNIDVVSLKVKDTSPDLIINCAAYTKVDKAEEEKGSAFKVNSLGVRNLAVICAELKISLCHISTDYVFDGKKKSPYTPYDTTHPLNIYGASKLEGEKHIEQILKNFYIVRTSGLYGIGGNNFVSAILKFVKDQPNIKVVTNQITAPTSTKSLSDGIKMLVKSKIFGKYHITDDSDNGISWYDFAKEIVAIMGARTNVIPITSDEFPRPAKRPQYSVLGIEEIKSAAGYQPIKRTIALKRFLSL